MANGVAAITATVTVWKATSANALGSVTPAPICDTRGQVLSMRVGPTPITTSVEQANDRQTVQIGWCPRLIMLHCRTDSCRRPAKTACGWVALHRAPE